MSGARPDTPVRLGGRDYLLSVRIADEAPAETQPLHEPAILDFDAQARLQGCEILAAPEFGLAERLARLAPFMIDLDEDAGSGVRGQGSETVGRDLHC